jgi:3-deoxy-D-manno-octulosonate 8-phosphate phosphatase (KDO 8-P phosphatase)
MATLYQRAAGIRLLVLDVDGVLTDGRVYLDADGREIKSFHTRDGHGLKCIAAAGIEIGVISGRDSQAVAVRMSELGIRHVFQGHENKIPVFETLLDTLGIATAETAYMGDDVLDLPILKKVGLAATVNDCHPALRAHVHFRTRRSGGQGAVRELCDLLLAARR